jgi:N-acetyl-gamma-glutamylphosphate reductase
VENPGSIDLPALFERESGDRIIKVLIIGATGMVGQRVLRECLRALDVEVVQTVGRTRSACRHCARCCPSRF